MLDKSASVLIDFTKLNVSVTVPECPNPVYPYLIVAMESNTRHVINGEVVISINPSVFTNFLARTFAVDPNIAEINLDNSLRNHGKEIESLCEINRVDINYSPLNKPACGAMVERFFQRISSAWRGLSDSQNMSIDEVKKCVAGAISDFENEDK